MASAKKGNYVDKLYSVKGAAAYLGGISSSTVEGLLSAGKLKRTKILRRTMIKESELQRFIDAGGSEPSPGGRPRRSPDPVPEVAA